MLLMTTVMIIAVRCCIVQVRRKRQTGTWNYCDNVLILYFTIVCTVVCYPQVTNNKYNEAILPITVQDEDDEPQLILVL